MNILLTRNKSLLYGIFGELKDEQNNILAVTLEHAFAQPDGSFAPAVPVGTYTCERRRSPKFGYDLFILLDVPGHTYIEMHIGNVNSDSDGCILLGTYLGTNCILDSRIAFNKFMSLQTGIDQFQMVIH